MQEALTVAVLTFAGLTAWAALINVAVKVVFDYFDPDDSVARPRSSPQASAPLRVGEEQFSQRLTHAIAIGPIQAPGRGS